MLYIIIIGYSVFYLTIQCVLPLLFSFILQGEHGDNFSCLQWGEKKLLNHFSFGTIQSRISGEKKKIAELQRESREIEHAQVPSSGSCSWKKDCPLSCAGLFVYLQPSSWKSADQQRLARPPKQKHQMTSSGSLGQYKYKFVSTGHTSFTSPTI